MADTQYRLSPYCVFWVDPGNKTAQLAHALFGSRFEIAADLLRALVELSCGRALDDVRARLGEGANEAMQMLIDEKVLVPESQTAEWEAPDLFRNRLNPLELAFHRSVNEGGFIPGEIDGASAPPAAKAATGKTTVVLHAHAGTGRGMDMATCLARRHSSRNFGARPVARAQLEQFLELTARAYALRDIPGMGWVSVRNYPSAGARYPLEVYPVVYNVESLPEGLYHYRPFSHTLEAIESDREHREMVAEMARRRMSPTVSGRPAVLFLVTAVFARTCWKYRGMPYQAILMETGALYQTMYLAASLLDLAPCAIGAFPELATAQLIGVDSRDEAQVGMFALGVADLDALPCPQITAVRWIEESPFAGGERGRVVEFAFSDSTKQILPVEDIELQTDGTGALRCILVRGRQIATIAEGCREEALRLLQHAGGSTA